MATVYASLVSLMNVLIRIQHPSCPASFYQLQIQSLFDKVSFLIDFIEEDDKHRRGKLTQGLARRMTDAVLAAEEWIESYIVDQINAKAEGTRGMCYDLFCQDLQKSIQETDLIMEDVIKIKENICEIDGLPPSFSKTVDSLPFSSRKNTMVGFEEDLKHLLELLTEDQSSRQIISIVGMGGIGKTTLATNVYKHPRILRCFHVRGWATVSQNCSVREIIICLLRDLSVHSDKEDILEDEIGNSNEELGGKLYKCLSGTKYLIILDDIWSHKVWDEIRMFFPENNNGSRILLSTRLINVAIGVGSCSPHEMKFLDLDKSWDLLSQTVFGQEKCPLELEELGKKISRSCKGLPLTIVVIGGLLKRSHKTREYWEQIAKNVNSIANVDNDDNCLNVLSLSYHHLPIHLKPCFLCLPYSNKGTQFKVTKITQGWIVSGILKPNMHKTLEEVALEYLNDLIDRNIIVVKMQDSNGKKKRCTVHDLFVDFGRREATNERFSCILRFGKLFHPNKVEGEQHLDTLDATYAVCPGVPILKSVALTFKSNSYMHKIKQLRVLTSYCEDSLQTILQLYNARFLRSTKCRLDDNSRSIPSSISLLWNLDTLIVETSSSGVTLILPSEIWDLPHLRHLVITKMVILRDPVGAQIDCVLNSLQTLTTIKNFNVTKEVVTRIPNLMKLGIRYTMLEVSDSKVSRCFNNIAHLHKLETLKCAFENGDGISACVFNELETLTLPRNLIKLSLSGSYIPWENMSIVGSLPSLEVLILQDHAFCGMEWNSNDGEFQRLKYLSIELCDIEIWHADGSHFPQLERLDLDFLKLKEIPMGIGEVNTLVSMKLVYCEVSAIISAKEILDERQSQGIDDLVIQVTPYPWNCNSEVMSLADDSFQIRIRTFDLSNKRKGDQEWLKLQIIRMYYVFAMTPVLAPGHRELDEIISDFSNDIIQFLIARFPISKNTQDDVLRRGTILIHGLFLFHKRFHMSKNTGTRDAVQPNDPSSQIIPFMIEKILLNIENHVRSATN